MGERFKVNTSSAAEAARMGRLIYYGVLSRSKNSEFMSELLYKMENNGKQNLKTCSHIE